MSLQSPSPPSAVVLNHTSSHFLSHFLTSLICTVPTQRFIILGTIIIIITLFAPASSNHCLLHDAGARTVFGSHAFCHAAPTIWNSLAADLTDNFNNMLLSGFKCSLKSYFYKLPLTTSINHKSLCSIATSRLKVLHNAV